MIYERGLMIKIYKVKRQSQLLINFSNCKGRLPN